MKLGLIVLKNIEKKKMSSISLSTLSGNVIIIRRIREEEEEEILLIIIIII